MLILVNNEFQYHIGNNYSNASITLVSNATGLSISDASLTPIIGPVGGHGSDATKELGGFYVLTNARLEYGESNNFTTNNDFRKVGIVAQPKFANGDVATSSVIDQATTIVLNSWNGTNFQLMNWSQEQLLVVLEELSISQVIILLD